MRLQRLIVDFVGISAAKWSQKFVFTHSALGRAHIGPFVIIVMRRISAYRRCFYKFLALRPIMSAILRYYHDIRFHGPYHRHVQLSELRPQPLLNSRVSVAHTPDNKHFGSLSLLLSSVHGLGAVLDADGWLLCHGELPLDVSVYASRCWDIHTVSLLVANARTTAADKGSTNEGLREIDKVVWRGALKY